MNNSVRRYYPLFVGLTRTPMLMGVTQTYFALNLGGCGIVALAMLHLLPTLPLFIMVIGVFLLLHVIGLIGCSSDERFFEVLSGKWELACRNNLYWGCNSYDPS
jgi:type IV secretory pathway VirB3-like protein